MARICVYVPLYLLQQITGLHGHPSSDVSDVFYVFAGNFTGRGTALFNKQKQKESIQEAPLSLFSLATKMLPE
jgi:hypothetical protein